MIVTLSQKIWQQSILPSLTILSVLLVQVLYTGGGILWLLAFINITFLGLHFHVSYYPIFFINSIVIALVIMKRLLSRNYTVLFGAVNYLLHLLLWVRMISPNDTVNPLQHFSWASQKFSPEAYFHQLSDITMLIINSTFHNQPTIVSASIVVLAVIILLATWRSNKHHISMLVLAYLSTIFLLALYPLPYFFGRLMVFFPLVLLLISLSLRRLIIYKFLFIISGLMVVFVSSDSTIERLFSSPPGEIERTKDLTRYIYQNYRQSCSPFCPSLPNFRIYSVENIPEESDWYTGQYWYMLEEISGVKLVHIVDYGNNLEPIIEIPNIRYLICPILGRSRGDVERLCISEHTKLPVYTFLKDYEAEQLKLPHNIAPHYVVYRWVNAYEKRR